MAVWGIGAYDPIERFDYSDIFLDEGCAYIGYLPKNANAIFQMVSYIKPGDLIFIKSSKGNYMCVKAVGIVRNNKTETFYDNTGKRPGEAFSVTWKAKIKGEEDNIFNQGKEHLTAYQTTIFEEYNPDVIEYVINKIINPNKNEIVPFKEYIYKA